VRRGGAGGFGILAAGKPSGDENMGYSMPPFVEVLSVREVSCCFIVFFAARTQSGMSDDKGSVEMTGLRITAAVKNPGVLAMTGCR